MSVKPKVLFICTGNAVRSQMAEGFLKHYAGDQYEVYSAGVEPKEIDPRAVAVMEEMGISLAGQISEDLRTYLGQKHFGYVFTLCDYAESRCPTTWLLAQNHYHWDILDPAKVEGTDQEILNSFRAARDQLDAQITAWLAAQNRPVS